MLRNWLRQLRKHLFGSKTSGRVSRRKPRSVRLGVEGLETREVMSASASAISGNGWLYQIQSGNLYRSAPNSNSLVLIDQQVTSLAMDPAGWVYEVNHGGTLTRWAPNGGSWSAIDAQVSSLAMDSYGWVYEVNHGGNLTRWAPNGGTWSLIDQQVSSLAMDPYGWVYEVNHGGTLTRWAPNGGSWSAIDAQVSSLAMDSYGWVYEVNHGGNLTRWAPNGGTWFLIDQQVSSLAMDPYGWVYEVNHGGTLTRWAPNGGSWSAIDAQVSSLAIAPDGWTYELNHGTTLTCWAPNGGFWTAVGRGIQSFTINRSGEAVELTTSGLLFEFTQPAGGGLLIGGGTVTLSTGSAGQSYSTLISPSGSSSGCTYTLDSLMGLLPPGLSLSSSGILSGTPTKAGTYNFTVEVAVNGTSLTAYRVCSLLIIADGLLVRNPEGTVVIIQNGKACWISAPVEQFLGNPSSTLVSDAQFNSLPGGPQDFPNGMIVAAENHPKAASGIVYSAIHANLSNPSAVLFGATQQPSYLDVEQGAEGDCWLLASLAEVAARAPSDIKNMFTFDGTAIENGALVGIYSVRFFNSNGATEYVTVDTELPAGGFLYDHPINGVLWVALAEKAYAEANYSRFVTTGHEAIDSYDALNGGWPSWALRAITGNSASEDGSWPLPPAVLVPAEWNAGQFVVLDTNNPPSSYILPTHCYAIVGYNASNSTPFEVFNPWGGTTSSVWCPQDNQVYGLFNCNATFLNQNLGGTSVGSGAVAGMPEQGNGTQHSAFLSQNVAGESLGSRAATGLGNHSNGSQQIADLGATNFSEWAPSTFEAHQVDDQINANAAFLSQAFRGMADCGNGSQETADPWRTDLGLLLNRQ